MNTKLDWINYWRIQFTDIKCQLSALPVSYGFISYIIFSLLSPTPLPQHINKCCLSLFSWFTIWFNGAHAAWLAGRPVGLADWSELESSHAPMSPAISWGAHVWCGCSCDAPAQASLHFLLLWPSKPKELPDGFRPIYKVLMWHIPCQAWEGHKPGLWN